MGLVNLFGIEFSLYLIGVLQADGHYWHSKKNKKGKIGLEISRRDKDLIRKLDDRIKKIFNTSIYERTRDTQFKENFSSSSFQVVFMTSREFQALPRFRSFCDC